MFSFMSPGMMPNFGGYRTVLLWNGVSGIVSGLIGLLLLAASIGCLRMVPWGRRGMVWYALIALAWIAVKLVVTLTWVIPAEEAFMNSVMTTAPPATAPAPPPPTPLPTTQPTGWLPATEMTSMTVELDGTRVVNSSVTTSGGAGAPTMTAAFVSSPVGVPFNTATFRVAYAVGWAFITAVYPVIVLIYMTRPRTKGAFTPTAEDHRQA
jgi:hypothetical protein